MADYQHRGIRNLTILHEHHLREFVGLWRRFRRSPAELPSSGNSAYESKEALLRHVLGCARHYMVWMCEKLQLPDPGIREVPSSEEIATAADEYLEHVLTGWRTPLVSLDERTADRSVFESGWGVDYCIDAMLEHAVLHPIRHTFQLRELMGLDPVTTTAG